MAGTYAKYPALPSGGSGDAFTIIQPDHGTSPTATTATSTLTLTSSDSSVTITGNSATKTINFQAAGGSIFDPTSATQTITAFDDFDSFTFPLGSSTGNFGPLHLVFAGTGTVARDAPTVSEQNRYGIVSETFASTQSIGYYGGIANAIYPGTGTFTFACALQIGSNIPTGPANSWVAQWGLADSFPTFNRGAYFSMNYLNASFQCVTFDGVATSTTSSGVSFAANTWYTFRVVLSPTAANFYINGTLVATNTTRLPTAPIGPVTSFTNQTGAGTTIRHDWVMMQYTLGSSRGPL